MLAGLTAGAIAAIVAALVSLPLHSPVDSAFNSATVAVACMALGLIAGFLYTRWGERPLIINGVLAAIFIVVLIVSFIGNSLLDRFLSFVLPLAAIAFVIIAILTPLMTWYLDWTEENWKRWTPVAVSVIAALAVGFALITQGDAESGELALPPPSPATAVPSTAVPTSTTAAPTSTIAPTVPLTTVATRPAATRPSAAPTNTPAPAEEPTQTVAVAETPEDGQSFVISEGSEVKFVVEEELGRSPIRFDAVISGTGLTGTANLDGTPSVVTLDLHSLYSDQQYRDQYIRNRMFSSTPEAVVTIDELPDLPQSFYDGQETTGQVNGSLQIGDAITPLVFDVTARNDGDVINILGAAMFTWEQVGLEKPTARSVVYLADEVRVQVLLIARAP